MERLTISALNRIYQDSLTWEDPLLHRTILTSVCSVLISSLQCLAKELVKGCLYLSRTLFLLELLPLVL